jgi:hypothetical protein
VTLSAHVASPGAPVPDSPLGRRSPPALPYPRSRRPGTDQDDARADRGDADRPAPGPGQGGRRELRARPGNARRQTPAGGRFVRRAGSGGRPIQRRASPSPHHLDALLRPAAPDRDRPHACPGDRARGAAQALHARRPRDDRRQRHTPRHLTTLDVRSRRRPCRPGPSQARFHATGSATARPGNEPRSHAARGHHKGRRRLHSHGPLRHEPERGAGGGVDSATGLDPAETGAATPGGRRALTRHALLRGHDLPELRGSGRVRVRKGGA